MSMKESNIPKGVNFSYILMTAPLALGTIGLLSACMGIIPVNSLPVATPQLARSLLRMISLSLAFQGGIHYGFSAATYELAFGEQELKRIKYQMIFSFVPAAMSFGLTSMILFQHPLLMPAVLVGFTGLMLTQLLMFRVDLKFVEYGLAPEWFTKFRSFTFAINILLTSILFWIFYSNSHKLQRRNDNNRIMNLKTALELEDEEFLKMVDDLHIDYDEHDLKEIETQVISQLNRQHNRDTFMNNKQ